MTKLGNETITLRLILDERNSEKYKWNILNSHK